MTDPLTKDAPRFARYIGIDYSGAETADSSLKGLRVYRADEAAAPTEVPPPPSPRKYWSRQEIAQWLVEVLTDSPATLVGIDHGFSFPVRYFEKHQLAQDWAAFLDDFCHHWPTHEPHVYVDFVRDGSAGHGAARAGNRRWRRLTEERAGTAKSVFHFDVQGQVAKSTHAGLPWLRFLRRELRSQVHFWPFDGWQPPRGTSVIVEAYPTLYRSAVPPIAGTKDQQDAFAIAAWLQLADRIGTLARHLAPVLSASDRRRAEIEGWILGIDGEAVDEGAKSQRAASGGTRHGRAQRIDTVDAARAFLAGRLKLELVLDPPRFYGVDTSTMDVFRVVEDSRLGASQYVGVVRATGEAIDLGKSGD